jgi:DNA-binding response OmpR family regulator
VKVLIVEDDTQIADALAFTLGRHGHETAHAATAAEALSAFEGNQMILLDLGLPDLDGHELCRRLRTHTDTPIIAVTARSEEVDRVMALHIGADDYVTKPFSYYELLARIEAVLRRTARSAAPAPARAPERERRSVLQVGPLNVDLRSRRVLVGGRLVRLTRKEFDLLTMLMEDAGTVRTREEIIATVWDENWYGSTRTLDVHVGSLRAKLKCPGWIETIRGVGYRIEVSPGPDAA